METYAVLTRDKKTDRIALYIWANNAESAQRIAEQCNKNEKFCASAYPPNTDKYEYFVDVVKTFETN